MNTRKRVWVPSLFEKHDLEPDKPININVPGVGLAGMLIFDLIDGKTGEVKQHLECSNIVTNTLMEHIGSGSDNNRGGDVLLTYHAAATLPFVPYFAMGTGSTAPTVDDTQLEAEIGPRQSDNGGFATTTGFVTSSGWPTAKSGSFHYHRLTRVFTETQVTGTLTEWGLFTASAGGPMGFRSLIKDTLGVPTPIVKQTGDQLRVTHEARIYPPWDQAAVSGTFVMAEVSYSYTASVLSMNNTQKWGWDTAVDSVGQGLGSWANAHAVTIPSASVIVDATASYVDFNVGAGTAGPVTNTTQSFNFVYISASLFHDVQLEWKPSVANYGPGGIKGFAFSPYSPNSVASNVQILINPAIPKTDVHRLRVTFRQVFGRTTLS